jgi:hypothetical protein
MAVPTVDNGHAYLCVTAGTSNATQQPTWLKEAGASVTDGGVTWKEAGPAVLWLAQP